MPSKSRGSKGKQPAAPARSQQAMKGPGKKNASCTCWDLFSGSLCLLQPLLDHDGYSKLAVL